ncbi:MAG TPA: N-acetylmuramoyl-L-alanine amidase [Steroidobacteraceae bacterium]|nr:N-acetylmuramoyl-L-alanine amidase [Steroidobacteraceae bacterium]
MRVFIPLVIAGLAATAMPAPAQASAVLRSATLEPGAAALVLDLSARRQPRLSVLDAPRRLVIDLPDTRRDARLRLPTGGAVASFRASPRPHGAYRLVLEVAGLPAALPTVQASAGARGFQLRIALGLASAAGPAASPATPRPVQPAHSPGRDGRDIVVAVDAGHGGEDPGASGPGGTHEKDVTLAIARALAARLNARPGIRAVLTRDADRLIDLRERFERARAAHADLFVSIHADAVRDRSIAGASVYTLSYHGASSEAARRLADRENATVLKGGVSLADVNPALASVLLDAAQSQIMGASVEAADQVLAALDEVGAVRKKVVQHAGFMVLKSPDVPSMLVETAYISNPAEERKLRSASYQEQLARAIESGVVGYFQRHPPDGTSYANRRRDANTVEGDSGV